jgi:ABC-type glutathione transport system ATPase component
VDGVSFDVYQGETLGLVGESGCGKSTTGRTILQIFRPTSGSVVFDGVDLVNLKGRELRLMRRKMQMIFQDTYSSLNPRMTVGEIVGEPLIIHNVARGSAIEDHVSNLLKMVELNPSFANRYPHEFSGGQRQRVGVARWRFSLVHRLRRTHLRCTFRSGARVNLLKTAKQFNLTHLFSRRSFDGTPHQRTHRGDVSGRHHGTG